MQSNFANPNDGTAVSTDISVRFNTHEAYMEWLEDMLIPDPQVDEL
jgi:hypothetical protein